MSEFYKIKVVIGKISFELESHDKEWLKRQEEKYIGELMKNPQNLQELSALEQKESKSYDDVSSNSSLTIQEFYNKYITSGWTRPKIGLFLIYYLEKFRKLSKITTTDLKDSFKEISFPKYDKINFTDILNQQKAKGLLNKTDGGWKLTITGTDYILSKINN